MRQIRRPRGGQEIEHTQHCTHVIEKIIVGQEKEAKRRARAREKGGQDTEKELGKRNSRDSDR
jgi:hypothetical protein